ncbi:conserved hypothetical protein [Trichinella spiralis]|uniref:hypothetical protein n=1 Tax=Trichinella spiralis TaxID=6334 RepID=UPI0001EFED2A|nr:conserved hypothetical protein [Trichinella spiralis]
MFGLLKPCWLSTFNFAWHEVNRRTLLLFFLGTSRGAALCKHARTSRRCAIPVPIAVRSCSKRCFTVEYDSITILRVTYPVDLHTVLSWSNGQMVNMYGKMQKWQSQLIIYSNE